MKFGVREICDVVLKAKTAQKIGNKVFYKNEPVCYFDSLKTSSMESQANAVYATGGRGNSRLVAWEGERTVTFTMEDALISPIGFSILSGAGVIAASAEKSIYMHTTERTDKFVVESNGAYVTIQVSNTPFVRGAMVVDNNGEITYTAVTTTPNAKEDFIYVMLLDENGEIFSEPYIASEVVADRNGTSIKVYKLDKYSDDDLRVNDLADFAKASAVLVDYYVEKTSGAYQVDISPETFGGNFYLEASTLFRTTQGVDVPAEFVIPNCKIQSNFTFTMAGTGDPSTFTFTMDAFPDYTRWDKTKKVYAAIQFTDAGEALDIYERYGTSHNNAISKGSEEALIAGNSSYTTVQAAYDAEQKAHLG